MLTPGGGDLEGRARSHADATGGQVDEGGSLIDDLDPGVDAVAHRARDALARQASTQREASNGVCSSRPKHGSDGRRVGEQFDEHRLQEPTGPPRTEHPTGYERINDVSGPAHCCNSQVRSVGL